MTMQRRHFELIAEVIREITINPWLDNPEVGKGREAIANAFARKLRTTNPNFNEARFLRACGVTDA